MVLSILSMALCTCYTTIGSGQNEGNGSVVVELGGDVFRLGVLGEVVLWKWRVNNIELYIPKLWMYRYLLVITTMLLLLMTVLVFTL